MSAPPQAIPPQVVQLACPNCRTPIRAQVFTVVDVGVTPELKNYLLAGQLNTVACQNCGYVSMLAAPLVYNDPAKQLFLVHFPQQLNAKPDEQERFIGDATSALMRSVPADVPKGYLLAPRRFLTMNSLIEAVLEADGITKEMIEAQRKRVDLIGQLADAYVENEEQLPALVEEHRAELDQEFFATLSAFAAASAQSQDDDSGRILVELRDKLVELTGFTGQLEGEFADDEQDPSVDEVLTRLLEVSDEELEPAVTDMRPLIDYGFFEAWTDQIDAAAARGDTARAEWLTERRARILATVEELDRSARELFEAGATLLKQVLAAPDAEAELRANHERIDEAFLLVIEANMAAAERGGNSDIVARLEEIRSLAIRVAEESLSPEERLINRLLQAESQPAASTLLRQNPDLVNTDFVKRLNTLATEFEQQGRQEPADRLRQLAREAGVMLF